MDDQRTDQASRGSMRPIANWIAICVIPVGPYLDWAHGRLWWGDFVIAFTWCVLVSGQIIEHSKPKAAKDAKKRSWQFDLRSAFFVMTLVAVLLGIIALLLNEKS